MALEPVNYTAMMPQIDLGQSIMQGLQSGAAIKAMQMQSQEREKQKLAQEQYRQDLQGALNNPTQQTWAGMIAKYPTQREAFAKSAELYGKDKAQGEFWQGMEVSNALENGAPEIAREKLTEIVTARKNSGQPAGIYEQVLTAIDSGNIKGAQGATNMALSMLDPDNFQKALQNRVKAATTGAEIAKTGAEAKKLGAEATQAQLEAGQTPERLQIEAAKGRAEIRNIDSQVNERAQRLGLDRDKLQSDVEMKLYEFNQKENKLDGDGRKLVNDAVISSVTAGQVAGQMEDLSQRLDAAGGGYGAAAKASEWLKEATGNQDYMTELRKEYTRIKNSQALKMLPPGPATDKDIALAMSGFPSDTSDAKTISSFLRGMAKMNNLTAATETAKAEWVNSVGSLGRARNDIEVDGIKVPAGMSFMDFTKGYVQKKAKQGATESQQQAVPQRSYMRWGTPQNTNPGALGSGTFGQ